MTRKRIAIVGAGFSGAAVAIQLMRGRGKLDVTLIERGAAFGRGLAYGATEPNHLLNVRASNMSALADEPGNFATWLARTTRGATPMTFATRKRYGDYLQHLLGKAERARLFGGLRRVRGDVVSCRREKGAWELELSSGRIVRADAVVLALGNPPASLPETLATSGAPVIRAWDTAALKRIPKGDVLIMGAGLTMIDVALSLAAWRKNGVIYALSRRGAAPRAHLDQPFPPPNEQIHLPLPLSEALHAFRAEARRMAERGQPWQIAIDRLRRDTVFLWRRLPPEAQARFLRHLRPWWDAHRHRAAPEIGERVAQLREQGRLRVLAGEVASITPSANGFQVQHRQRGSMVRHRIEVAAVVNCTGADLDLGRTHDPLVWQMLSDGLFRRPQNGLGLEVDESGRVVDSSGAAQDSLFALGPITQGAFWESTAVPEIRTHAVRIAELLEVQG